MAPTRRSIALLALSSALHVCAAQMGPLLLDTTALSVASGGCVSSPGESDPTCTDVGVLPDASSCAAACANVSFCSAMTWHGPTTGEWAGHCVLRKDGVWAPDACGSGCDHTSSQKTSGWLPYSVPWPPAVKGYTSRPKVTWFGANASGLDSPSTLSLLAAHDVAGYGWQTGHPGGGRVGMGEEWQTAATTHLQDYLSSIGNPNNTVRFQYRQVQVALRLFAQCALAADSPPDSGFFLRDSVSGATCTGSQPWGTADPYWTFTNASAIAYWMDSVVESLITDASLTGGGGAIFFDESDQGQCGYRGGSCDFSLFNATAEQEGYVRMFAAMVPALNSAGIVPILSLDNRLAASGDGLAVSPPCALPEDVMLAALANTTWVRFYENWPGTFWAHGGPDTDAAMITNAILEGGAGVPNILHTGGACPAPARTVTRPGRLGGDIEFAVASYLIVQTPGTTLSVSDDWYDASFCWRPDYDVEFGLPLAPPVRTGTHSWARNYTRSSVTLDVSTGRSGQVYLLA